MKKLKFSLPVIIAALLFTSCDTLQHAASQVDTAAVADALGVDLGNGKSLTNTEIISGLKEALSVGTGNAVSLLNKDGGYLKNPKLKIPFPAEAQKVADKLRQLGMGAMVDKFEASMNKAAENAALQAKPIFVNAIKSMSIADAKNILMGGNGAATKYFKGKTSTTLFQAFSPKIKAALDQTNATKYWTDITSRYNKIPLVEKVNTDLTKYATDKALVGLFSTVEAEENKIRSNPAARVNDILKKVFGSI